MIEHNENLCSVKTNFIYWFSFDTIRSIISMKHFEHFESEKTRIEKKDDFRLITGKTCVKMVACMQ